MTSVPAGGPLTKQQAQAMRAFLWRDTYDDEATDSAVWEQNVRPWPTMDNLAAKGLVVRDGWFGPEDGWNWKLTNLGAAYVLNLRAAS